MLYDQFQYDIQAGEGNNLGIEKILKDKVIYSQLSQHQGGKTEGFEFEASLGEHNGMCQKLKENFISSIIIMI